MTSGMARHQVPQFRQYTDRDISLKIICNFCKVRVVCEVLRKNVVGEGLRIIL